MTVRGILCLSLLVSVTLFAQQEPSTTTAHTPSHEPAAKKGHVADDEASKTADIHRLLELTGTREMVEQMKSSMMEQFRRNAPGIPPDMFNEIMAELKADDLMDSMIPVYSKHFTGEDIKQMIAFYQSPFGQKVLREMPQIILESNEVGTRWGDGVVTRVATRWRNQGKISQHAYEELMDTIGPEDEH
ncbi:MAG: DUF2059 domain-containing protein [Terriglobia bacterium]|jgi:hypothetical protein|nr:DUF2059 domain-containing protein [Terriglobia bacterium]